ncbi:MAG TPA: hypothetical protein VKB09_15730 [Thermomicrobiales bacterium]|nr:hypothetical protein [Thermomicrobiales bacterium]
MGSVTGLIGIRSGANAIGAAGDVEVTGVGIDAGVDKGHVGIDPLVDAVDVGDVVRVRSNPLHARWDRLRGLVDRVVRVDRGNVGIGGQIRGLLLRDGGGEAIDHGREDDGRIDAVLGRFGVDVGRRSSVVVQDHDHVARGNRFVLCDGTFGWFGEIDVADGGDEHGEHDGQCDGSARGRDPGEPLHEVKAP